jgi:Ni/Co efflux regulator RcnB
VKSLMTVVLASVLLGSLGVTTQVEASDHDRNRKEWKHRRSHDRDRDRDHDRVGRRDRYFADREVLVIRDYYRPHRRSLPGGLRHRYYRTGYLPHGWAKRMRRMPVYVERELVVLPHGYHRGIIDGHAVVYNASGLIIDVAVLF